MNRRKMIKMFGMGTVSIGISPSVLSLPTKSKVLSSNLPISWETVCRKLDIPDPEKEIEQHIAFYRKVMMPAIVPYRSIN